MFKKMKKRKILLLSVISLIVLLGLAFFIYTSQYYTAAQTLDEYKTSYNSLTFIEEEDYIKISKANSEKNKIGLIFYQGGKVEYEAYIPLMAEFALKGYSCYLVDMPFHLAVFNINAADSIIEKESGIEEWYLGGHSLGGAMASSYAANNSDKLKGLFLLGAYPASDLSKTSLKMLVLYGENDLVMNQEAFEETKANAPKDSYYQSIEGGNHAGFGDYGEQAGDGKASISNKEQISRTIEYSESFLLP